MGIAQTPRIAWPAGFIIALVCVASLGCEGSPVIGAGLPDASRPAPTPFEVVDTRQTLGLSPNAAGDCLVFTDFDGDGADDLVVEVQDEGLGVYYAGERGGFRPFTPIETVPPTRGEFIQNCVAADFDDDGRVDLAVLRASGRVTILGNASGTPPEFRELMTTDVLAHASFLRPVDFDRDGRVDLFAGVGYHGEDGDIMCDDARPVPVCRLARGAPPSPYLLMRSAAPGVSFSSVALPTPGYSNGAAITDFDDDGWPELFVSNELGFNALFEADGRARQTTLTDTLGRRGGKAFNQGMGAVWGDVEGVPCLYNADFGPSELFCLQPDGSLRNIAAETGIARRSAFDVAWSPVFADMNLDGHQDVYVANAVSASEYDEFVRAVAERGGVKDVTDLLLLGNGARGFDAQRVAPMFMHPTMATEVLTAVGDHDGDGRPEVAIARPSALADARLSLVTSAASAPGGHWLEVVLARASRPGASGNVIGAKVILREGGRVIDWNVVGSGGGLGSSSLTSHFGLGSRARIDAIGVRWPDGATEVEWFAGPFAVDRVVRVVERR